MSVSELPPPSRREAALRHGHYYAAEARKTAHLYTSGSQEDALKLFARERAQFDEALAWLMSYQDDLEIDALLVAYAEATVYTGDLFYDMRRERIPQLEATLAAAQRMGNRRIIEERTLCNLGVPMLVSGISARPLRSSIGNSLPQHIEIEEVMGRF